MLNRVNKRGFIRCFFYNAICFPFLDFHLSNPLTNSEVIFGFETPMAS